MFSGSASKSGRRRRNTRSRQSGSPRQPSAGIRSNSPLTQTASPIMLPYPAGDDRFVEGRHKTTVGNPVRHASSIIILESTEPAKRHQCAQDFIVEIAVKKPRSHIDGNDGSTGHRRAEPSRSVPSPEEMARSSAIPSIAGRTTAHPTRPIDNRNNNTRASRREVSSVNARQSLCGWRTIPHCESLFIPLVPRRIPRRDYFLNEAMASSTEIVDIKRSISSTTLKIFFTDDVRLASRLPIPVHEFAHRGDENPQPA